MFAQLNGTATPRQHNPDNTLLTKHPEEGAAEMEDIVVTTSLPPDPPLPPDSPAPVRRRVRVALATLRRVAGQQDRFVLAYAAATTPQQRLAAAGDALRAAAATGAHQPDTGEVELVLDRVIDAMTTALSQLHHAQQRHAETTIRADQRRIARNEQRRRGRGRSRTDPTTDDPTTDFATTDRRTGVAG